jgi:hypothetical protein
VPAEELMTCPRLAIMFVPTVVKPFVVSVERN